ncbi:axonemal dynein light intermediate polypeptide 1 isoform X2 [Pituophis catenifer annectens]|uniref:axonemal dynein light intermediate polypeptide 1 isoform X2 n=1 Tax=Pituophis catenifer annectens TaxID=94852 RepID=UPI0039935E26
MIPPADSLLRYETPVLVSRNTEKRSPKARPLKGTPQLSVPAGPVSPPKGKAPSPSVDPSKQAEEILNAILPPREWTEENQLWVQQVSSTPSTRMDVVHLQEQLDLKLQQRQARETGICPVRRELYSQCFGERRAGGDRGRRGRRRSLSCPSLPRRRADPAGDHQLRRARAAAAARAGRDPDDHRGVPDALREQRGLRHEEGLAGRAGQIRHGKKGSPAGVFSVSRLQN